MHELAFADAARPMPSAVLILRLRVYTLGHELLLLRRRNPLLVLERADFDALPAWQQIRALKDAVLTCNQTWLQNQKPPRWLRLWSWATRHANYAVELAEFRNYLAAGRQLLKTLSSQVKEDAEAYEIANLGDELDGGRPLGAPLLAQLLNFVSHLKLDTWNLTHVWDFPYALAGNLFLTQLETQGHIYIENYHEAEEREAMAKHRADAKREREEEAMAARRSPPAGPSASGLATPPPNLDAAPAGEGGNA